MLQYAFAGIFFNPAFNIGRLDVLKFHAEELCLDMDCQDYFVENTLLCQYPAEGAWRGASPKRVSRPLLLHGWAHPNVELFKYLLTVCDTNPRLKLDVKGQEEYLDRTLLHFIWEFFRDEHCYPLLQEWERLQLLLEHGVYDVNVTDLESTSPLDRICYEGGPFFTEDGYRFETLLTLGVKFTGYPMEASEHDVKEAGVNECHDGGPVPRNVHPQRMLELLESYVPKDEGDGYSPDSVYILVKCLVEYMYSDFGFYAYSSINYLI